MKRRSESYLHADMLNRYFRIFFCGLSPSSIASCCSSYENACLPQQQPTISREEEEEDWEDMCVHSDGIYAIFMALWKGRAR